MPILVGIVEDHPTMLRGTIAILNESRGIRVVASGPTVDEVLECCDRFDVLLLELSLSDGSSLTTNLRALRSLGAPVVAYTSGDDPRLIREAAGAGAAGMIRASAEVDEIVDAVRRAARHETVVTPEWVAALDSAPDHASARLTLRESEVFSLYASGETAEQVAQRLYLSRETVLDHIRRIRAKYAAVDRAAPTKVDLFRRAVEDGLLQPA